MASKYKIILIILVANISFIMGGSAALAQSTRHQQVKNKSELWIEEHIFPFLDASRLLTIEEFDKLGVREEANLTIFRGFEKEEMLPTVAFGYYPTSIYYYSVSKEDSLLFTSNKHDDKLFDYFKNERTEMSVYRDSITNEIDKYIGPLKGTIYFGVGEIPEDVKAKLLPKYKAMCAIDNIEKIHQSSLSYSTYNLEKDKHDEAYMYSCYFSFENKYTTIGTKTVYLYMTIFLDQDMNILNDIPFFSNCDEVTI